MKEISGSGATVVERQCAAFTVEVDAHVIPVADVTRQNLASERRFDFALDGPLERARSVCRFVPGTRKVRFCLVADLECDAAIREPGAHAIELDLDDRFEFVLGKRVEDYDLVDTVDELPAGTASRAVLRARWRITA